MQVGVTEWSLNEGLQTSLENMEWWRKMGTKAKLFCREVESAGVKIIFLVFFLLWLLTCDFSLSHHGIQFCKVSQGHKMTIL